MYLIDSQSPKRLGLSAKPHWIYKSLFKSSAGVLYYNLDPEPPSSHHPDGWKDTMLSRWFILLTKYRFVIL